MHKYLMLASFAISLSAMAQQKPNVIPGITYNCPATITVPDNGIYFNNGIGITTQPDGDFE